MTNNDGGGGGIAVLIIMLILLIGGGVFGWFAWKRNWQICKRFKKGMAGRTRPISTMMGVAHARDAAADDYSRAGH